MKSFESYLAKKYPALSVGVVKYTDRTSAEKKNTFTFNEVTYWLWIAIRNASGQDSGGWPVLDLATELSSNLRHPFLALTGLDRRLEWPDKINRLGMSSAYHLNDCPDHILYITLVTNKTFLS